MRRFGNIRNVKHDKRNVNISTPHHLNTSPHQHLNIHTMDKYGLIGFPLGHSFSISYFNEKFANEGIKARYINYEIPQIEDLKEILASNPELRGLNVTIPYKQQVIPYLDELSPEARAIGAVNVIRVTHKNKNVILKGFNKIGRAHV